MSAVWPLFSGSTESRAPSRAALLMIWCTRMNDEPSIMASEIKSISGNTRASSAIWVPRSQRRRSVSLIAHHRLRVHLDRAKRKKNKFVRRLNIYLGRHLHYAVNVCAIRRLVHYYAGATYVRRRQKVSDVGLDIAGSRQSRSSREGSDRKSRSFACRIRGKLIDVVSASKLQDGKDQCEEQKYGESRLHQRHTTFCSLHPCHLATHIANTVPKAAATPNGVRTMERLLTLMCGCAL